MILWNIEKLKQNLIEGRLTDKDFFSYYLLTNIPFFLFLGFLFSTEQHNTWERGIFLLGGIISILACFRIHQKLSLDHFVEKITAISICALIRSFPFMIFFMIILTIPLLLFTSFTVEQIKPVLSILDTIFVSIYTYWHYRDFAKKFAASVDRI